MDAMGMINYVYENAKTVSEKNPIVTRKTDDSYLIDEEFHYMHFNIEKNDFGVCSSNKN
jgi:acyl-CoA oxidase